MKAHWVKLKEDLECKLFYGVGNIFIGAANWVNTAKNDKVRKSREQLIYGVFLFILLIPNC